MGLRIIHANANVLMQNGMRVIVDSGGGIDELLRCYNEKQLLDTLVSGPVDLVIIDHQCPNYFSIQTVFNVRKKFPDQKMLIISGINNNGDVLQVLEQGTQGYLTHECDEGEIKHAIFSIAKGEKFFCNKVLDIILNKHLYAAEDENCAPTSLTMRENEITGLIAQGYTNKQIAEQLFLSPHTIHSHRKNIMKKLGIKSTSELTVYAINVGLIQT
jgi:DNA-binding NarL/FixJ family response regulator